MEHAAIATLLGETHSVPEWWSQTITVGYEQARGLRRKNEATDGFQAGVSKTINAATAKLYRAWEDEATRTRWMGDHKVEIRVANTDKNIRMTWLVQGPDEGSSVEVYFWPKDANKCLVQVQQRKLADAEAVQRVRAFWSVKLENLRDGGRGGLPAVWKASRSHSSVPRRADSGDSCANEHEHATSARVQSS
jgi:uncharacterized protein YndB with AHSA1/START domain